MQNNARTQIERVADVVNQVLTAHGYSERRCMAASAQVGHFLEQTGFTVMLWTGSVDYLSRRGVRLIEDRLFDMEEKNITTKRLREIRRYEAQGLRVISCRVNERPDDNDLGGHVCVVAQHDNQCFFIDPTSGQFARDDRGKGAKHAVHVPAKFITQLTSANEAGRVLHHIKRRTWGLYKAGRIDALADQKFKDPSGDHDLNPRRIPAVYREISAALA